MRILLLSAYDAASHRYWHEGLKRHLAEHEWTVLTLPARFFSWRIRGNSLTWAGLQRDVLQQDYDALIATSMVDLSTLRGLVPQLAQVPTLLYFHENQFAYPKLDRQHASVEPQMVSLYAALCADQLVFNSHYNRSTFLAGADLLLKKMPDGVPPGVVSELESKSAVLPVPLDASAKPVLRPAGGPLHIVWSHRWEYDKGPDRLLRCLENLPADLSLRFHVMGQRFRSAPAVFEQIRALLQVRGWLGTWGFVADRDAYLDVLQQSHAVLSTAIHDFQGLSVMEAVAAGCEPMLPDRLAYPEWFPASCIYRTDGDEALSLSARLVDLHDRWQARQPLVVPDLNGFFWTNLSASYVELLKRLVEKNRPAGPA